MPVPLTFQQQYYLKLIEETQDLHRLDAFPFILSGKLTVEAIRKSFELLVVRHECFRTKIVVVDGERMQEVDEPYQFYLEISYPSAAARGEPQTEGELRSFVREFSDRKYDLAVERLFRAALLSISDERHLLVVGAHHLFFDGWSLDAMLREVMQTYRELLHGDTPSMEKEELPYADYGVWQKRMHSEQVATHKSYWEKRLAGGVGIRWPGGNCAENGGKVLEVRRSFERSLNTQLHALARRARTLWSLELLAAYASVIYECCGQKDFVITTLLNDRDRAEHRSVMGFLAHPIFLRVEVKDDDTFTDLLRRLGQEYLGALLHRDFGETVMEHLDLCSGTVFQWFPAASARPESDTRLVDCRGQALTFRGNAIFPKKSDVAIYLIEADPSSLSAWVRHRPEVISAEAMERLLQQLERTLWRLVEQPNARVVQ